MTTPAPATPIWPAATAAPAIKPGIRTTEFWAMIAVDVAALAGALANQLPDRWAAIAASVSTLGYQLSRGLAKSASSPTP